MMESVSSSKRTYPVETNYEVCIICQKTSTDQLHKLTARGLETFRNAMKQRKDSVFYRLNSETEHKESFLSKSPMCHRSCRSVYTHKKELETFAAKKAKLEGNPPSCSYSRRESLELDYKTNCFICEKPRDSKGSWALVVIATKQRQEAVHLKAKLLDDDKMLMKIRGYGDEPADMIAADFKYHKSCMDIYMNRKPKEKNNPGCVSNIFDSTFEKLVCEIQNRLFRERSAFYSSQLRDRYRELLADRHADNAAAYQTSKLISRLIKYFGTTIQIVPQQGKPSLVCASDISVGRMCKLSIDLLKDLDDHQLETEFDDECTASEPVNRDIKLFYLAKHLRNLMKEVKQNQTEDFDETHTHLEISYAAAAEIVPTDLYNYLAWVLTDASPITENGERVSLPTSKHIQVLNIAQDMMACVTKIPMPKNVGLALHILKQTRSKDLVRMLHSLGHSISYDDAQRYISSVVQQIDIQAEIDGLFIPSNLAVGKFIQCALDNLDFAESTKDGCTLHATSQIIYQYQDNDDHRTSAKVPLQKSRKRSIAKQENFRAPSSSVTITDRRAARSLENIQLTTEDDAYNLNLLEDDFFIYTLLHMHHQKEPNFKPIFWNEMYSIMYGHKILNETVIAYGPLLPESPTSSDVVLASVEYFVKLTAKLGQQTTVITADQAIYDIIQGIRKKHTKKFENLVVRLGGFHIIENFLGAVGFFMRNSGIEDIFVESGICKRGTANKVISGKDYYKMIRYHSLVSEAMMGLLWSSFETFVREEGQTESIESLYNYVACFALALENNNSDASQIYMKQTKVELASLQQLWGQFLVDAGVTAQYWIMYIDMCQIAKRYIEAERSGNWTKHLAEVQNMLPYIVSSGHIRYAICLPMYLAEMRSLPETHPGVFQSFSQGNFTVHRSKGNFNGIWTDLALEQTFNRDGKTALLKGITQDSAAKNKYIKSVPFMTKVSESIKSMVTCTHQQSTVHGQSKIQTNRDQRLVESVKLLITNKMMVPFTMANTCDLINISTGEKARTTDLANARLKGLEAMYKAEHSATHKIISPKLETFAPKKFKPTRKQNVIRIYQEEAIVTRSLCFAQAAGKTIRQEAFAHEWTQYPSSLFEPSKEDDTQYVMRGGNKSDFMQPILQQADILQPTKLPDTGYQTVFVIDVMAFVQRYQTLGAKTFAGLMMQYRKKILQLKPKNCDYIHLIGDRYDFDAISSLKQDERKRRGNSVFTPEYILSDSLEIPDWKPFLNNPHNKSNLLHYMTRNMFQGNLPDNTEVTFGGMHGDRGKAISISSAETTVVESLACLNHEEADTRIFAHISHGCKTQGFRRAVIHANDTDIILLGMYHFNMIDTLEELWIQKNERYLPVHSLVQNLSTKLKRSAMEMCETLLSTYVLTGCDSVSYIYRRGKRRASSVALQMVGHIPNFAKFGDTGTYDVTPGVITDARNLMAVLYGKPSISSLNTLREHMFASNKGDIRCLPPTEDAFSFHLLRALYQLVVYKQAVNSDMYLPCVTNFGRYVHNNCLIPVLISKTPKPVGVDVSSCKCSKQMCRIRCSCKKAGVPCTTACFCFGQQPKCANVGNEDWSDTNISDDIGHSDKDEIYSDDDNI